MRNLILFYDFKRLTWIFAAITVANILLLRIGGTLIAKHYSSVLADPATNLPLHFLISKTYLWMEVALEVIFPTWCAALINMAWVRKGNIRALLGGAACMGLAIAILVFGYKMSAGLGLGLGLPPAADANSALGIYRTITAFYGFQAIVFIALYFACFYFKTPEIK